MAGRKTLGPALVNHLDGSRSAKERLEMILATISGQITIVSAAEQLGISEAMFYKLRNRVLQVSLEDLEPKPIGRPAHHATQDEIDRISLEAKVAELEEELVAQSLRLELAKSIPQVVKAGSLEAHKKTTRPHRLERSSKRASAKKKKAR
jgi:transposase-like protein